MGSEPSVSLQMPTVIMIYFLQQERWPKNNSGLWSWVGVALRGVQLLSQVLRC